VAGCVVGGTGKICIIVILVRVTRDAFPRPWLHCVPSEDVGFMKGAECVPKAVLASYAIRKYSVSEKCGIATCSRCSCFFPLIRV
jgi:hypothetical protein